MSSTYTTSELKQIAIEQDDAEAQKAIELLKARGEIPEDGFEERKGQTYNESRRVKQ